MIEENIIWATASIAIIIDFFGEIIPENFTIYDITAYNNLKYFLFVLFINQIYKHL